MEIEKILEEANNVAAYFGLWLEEIDRFEGVAPEAKKAVSIIVDTSEGNIIFVTFHWLNRMIVVLISQGKVNFNLTRR